MSAPPRQGGDRGALSSVVTPKGDPGKTRRAAEGLPIVPMLDGLRAFAILAIVLFHMIVVASDPQGDVARVLVYGTLPHMIDALFITSGFVLFLPTAARNGEFGSTFTYGLRRAARLLPAYWTALVLIMILIALWPAANGPSQPGLGSILAHFGLVHMPAFQFSDIALGFSIGGPLWTLSVEAAFYVMLPLIAGAFFRRPLLGLGIAAALTIAWKEAMLNVGWFADLFGSDANAFELAEIAAKGTNQIPGWLFSFVLGMGLAIAFVRLRERYDRERLEAWAPWGQLGSLLAFAVVAYLAGRYAITSIYPLPHELARSQPWISLGLTCSIGGFMLATALASPRWQWPLANPVSRSLGDMSYGIYLIHFPLLVFTLAAIPSVVAEIGAIPTFTLFTLPLILLGGLLSARWVEQPVRFRAQQIIKRRRDRAAESQA